ncbi:MAG: permease [Eubacteriales bacterium]
MKNIIVRYRVFIILFVFNVVFGLIFHEFGISSFEITKSNLFEMLSVIPPIFILLGLLDVWVDKETMMKFLGKGSGIKGVLIAFVLGSAAAGPLYAAFPVASTMLKKQASLYNVFIFIGAWSTTKIPMLTFEASSLGLSFMFARLSLSIIGIIIIAFIIKKTLSLENQQEVYNLHVDD